LSGLPVLRKSRQRMLGARRECRQPGPRRGSGRPAP